MTLETARASVIETPPVRSIALILGLCAVGASHGVVAAQTVEPTVWVTGAPLRMANGLHFGPDGRLYVASVVGREIVVLDPETGEVLDRLGPARGVEGPDDVAFGPDGSLYWTSILTGVVGRLAPDGEVSHQVVAPGVNPITVSDGGRVFVALCFLGDALYELDPALESAPRAIARDVGDGCASNGMDWGPDGALYGPRWFQGEITRIDVDSGEITTVVAGFDTPAALKFDSRGRMHVLDAATGEVVRVDLEAGSRETIAALEPGLDNLAFDASDRLYVSSFTDHSVVEVLEDGTTRTVSPAGLGTPGGVAVLGTSVYVADVLSLKELDAGTGDVVGVERSVIGVSPLAAPFTVSTAGERLVVTSWFGNTVQVWDPATREIVETHDDLVVPLNAVGFDGDLVVAELGGSRVVRIPAGDPTARIPLAEGLGVPAGLAASDGDLWVADRAGGAVLQVVADGERLAEPIPVATGLSAPEGLAVGADGRLLAVEAGAGRLSAIDPASGAVTTVAEGLRLGAPASAGAPPTWIFNGVAVAPSGAIYVTGDVAGEIYRVDPGSGR